MRYESAKTEKGNVGVSYESQEAADLQAVAMDENGCRYCTYCHDCHDCTGCSDCSDCHDCTDCTGCSDCSGCRYCTGCTGCNGCRYCRYCTGCTDCRYCTGCTDCTDCTDCRACHGCTDCTDTQGAMGWQGKPANNLLSLNGLRWPVSTDGKSIQIGCQHHTVEEWRAFDDREIDTMHEESLTFWKAHKDLVLSLAEVRKNMEEES